MLRKFRGWFSPNPIFELMNSGTTPPTRASKEAAAYDIYASEGWSIGPEDTVKIYTGLRCDFLPGWAAFIWDRSGLGLSGMHRFAGVIDSDYRGTWDIVLHNTTRDMFWIEPGDRIAQVVFQRVWQGRLKIRNHSSNPPTERGTGGFGSTGR